MSDGRIGNLSVVIKKMLYTSETSSLAAGIEINLPTGSDVTGNVDITDYVVRNQATHLVPYVGFLRTERADVLPGIPASQHPDQRQREWNIMTRLLAGEPSVN